MDAYPQLFTDEERKEAEEAKAKREASQWETNFRRQVEQWNQQRKTSG